MANYGRSCQIGKIAAGDGAYTAFGFGSEGTELTTSETAATITLTPTSTALAAGDMLVLLAMYCGIGTSASGFTVTGYYAGTTGGASGDTYVTFTETITEVILPRPKLVLQAVKRGSVW